MEPEIVVRADAALHRPDVIDEIVAPSHGGDDPIFGLITPLHLDDLVDDRAARALDEQSPRPPTVSCSSLAPVLRISTPTCSSSPISLDGKLNSGIGGVMSATSAPTTRERAHRRYDDLGLETGASIWRQFEQQPDRFDFVHDPRLADVDWSGFEP